ncbi:MAG: metallophosphatase [Flavobacteriales bacterium]
MNSRRSFIKKAGLGIAITSIVPLDLFSFNKDIVKISILHTNDIHSHIDPFVSGRNKGLGGLVQLSSLVNKIKSEEKNVLLLDSGDIFQGTPYFNKFGGELEFKLMSKIGYDCSTMGNHDFDNGLNGFEEQLIHTNFPFICTNYDFKNTILEGKTKNHAIFHKEGVKIGVIGLGIELKGLVDPRLYKNVKYLDPIEAGNKMAKYLKHDKNCDIVICLSHLGFKYKGDKVSDQVLAKETSNIDVILGGHTHTFLKKPINLKNKNGKNVLINQVGFGAIKLGKIDIFISKSESSFLTKNKILNVN